MPDVSTAKAKYPPGHAPVKGPTLEDRLALLKRPTGRTPLMQQSWGDLLFMHWPIEAETLRPLIPPPLEIDTFNGKAWVSISPFRLWNVRPAFLPAMPLVSSFNEVNVRTYVHYRGVPGVWFFSLDANTHFNVAAARMLYKLPYHYSSIKFEKDGSEFRVSMRRSDGTSLRVDWRADPAVESHNATPDTLEFFLVERYCLYTATSERVYRGRIHHEKWPLRRAELLSLGSDLLEANGIPPPARMPLTQHAGPVHVDVWPLEKLD